MFSTNDLMRFPSVTRTLFIESSGNSGKEWKGPTGGGPITTIGSFWPYATTLYDYSYRAMPLTAPQFFTPDEVYALVAWLPHQNGIIPPDVVMDTHTLPAVKMPNREGFVSDPRPDVPHGP